VRTFARRYAPLESGEICSWRVQPMLRSPAMRAPLETIAIIVPNEARPTM
jgi:hypothetical protein